jgi:hypothetical protein
MRNVSVAFAGSRKGSTMWRDLPEGPARRIGSPTCKAKFDRPRVRSRLKNGGCRAYRGMAARFDGQGGEARPGPPINQWTDGELMRALTTRRYGQPAAKPRRPSPDEACSNAAQKPLTPHKRRAADGRRARKGFTMRGGVTRADAEYFVAALCARSDDCVILPR